MELSKLFLTLCGFLLMICLVLSMTALISLRHAVAESKALQAEVKEVIAAGNSSDANDGSISASANGGSLSNTADGTAFYLKAVEGSLRVITEDGYTVRLLSVDVATLPAADRAALAVGIRANSWQEMLRLLQDYGG